MSSLTRSLGRVSLVFHSAIPSSGPWQQPSRRRVSCNCALPAFSDSTTPHILPTIHDRLPIVPESSGEPSEGDDNLLGSEPLSDEPCSLCIGYGCQRRSALQSLVSLVVALVMTIGIQGAPSSRDTFEDVPQTLSGGDKGQRIQKPKSAKAETCTRKCVSTCIRGGAGAPGEGPLNVRRPLVVFKEGFRSRNYCLVECSEICNLIGDGDDGP